MYSFVTFNSFFWSRHRKRPCQPCQLRARQREGVYCERKRSLEGGSLWKIKEQKRGLFVSLMSLILLLKQVHFGKCALELNLPYVNGSSAAEGGGPQPPGILDKKPLVSCEQYSLFTVCNGLNMPLVRLCALYFVHHTGINP